MTPSELHQHLHSTIPSKEFIRATFGGPRRGGPESPWIRATIRRIGPRWQIERFDAKKSFARVVENPLPELDELLALQFSAMHLTTASEARDIRITKRGAITTTARPAERIEAPATHNRVKDLPLPEGEADALLEAMGILGGDGRVKPTMRAKFTQINEFLKHLRHVLDDSGLKSLGRPIEILDAGCGSSHLTLAAHHFLTHKLGLAANLIGVDVNDEVIRKSTAKAERLGADSVSFVCAKIDAAKVTPDVVIALHACDTATDAALAAGIRHQARLILSVPCCHHHLNAQLKAANAEVLRPILRHGILHERQADLVTDAFRALLLRMHGYRTDVVEFTSPEHTARNLMIRAVRIEETDASSFEKEYCEMKSFFGVTPYLQGLICRSG